MRCTHYMKKEIIRMSGEMMFRQYYEMLNNYNPYSTGINYDTIIRTSIRMLEKKLSIDCIEVARILMYKIQSKARAYLCDKLRQENHC